MSLPIMRLTLTKLAFVVLLCVPSLAAQPSLRDWGNFGLHTVSDHILLHKYLESKNQLLLVGFRHVQILDLTTRRVVETRPIKLPPLYGNLSGSLISPDGRYMLILGQREAKVGKTQGAWVWDLERSERAAVLQQPLTNVTTGRWTDNGQTLVTFDRHFFDFFTRRLAVTFWNGQTFQYRNTIVIENPTWWHLSRDGARFFAASGKGKQLLGIKYVSDANGVIRIWKTATAELEKTIAIADRNYSPKTREISLTPDERFVIFVKKHKSNRAQTKVLAWEIDGSVEPRYEINPVPPVDDSRIVFSPSGEFFALDVGKNLQLYETSTGHKLRELPNVELPDSWIPDSVLLRVEYKSKNFFEMGRRMESFDATTGQLLYRKRLEYSESETPDDFNPDVRYKEVVDDTVILEHPTQNVFVTQSAEYVKLFDSRSGALLQTVISPPITFNKIGKMKIKHGATVTKALWSRDGKTFCVFSANGSSVSLWEFVGS